MNQVFNNIKEYLYNINKTENNNELSLSDKIQMLSHLNSNKNHLSSKINLMCQNTINTGTLYRNLEMFTDNLGTTEQTIFNKINNTKTLFGESSLKNILSKTTTDISLLSERQHNIKKFLNSTENTQLISQQLNTIKGNENEILWHWENISDHIKSLYEMVYFNFPYLGFINNILNSNEFLLNITSFYKIYINPAITIGSPIVTIILPLILLKFFKVNLPVSIVFKMFTKLAFSNMGIKSMFSIGIWIFFYLYSIYNTIKESNNLNKLVKILYDKCQTICKFVDSAFNITQICQQIGFKCEENHLDDLTYMRSLLYNMPKEYKFTTNRGKILKNYKRFMETKDRIVSIIKYVGQVDSHVSLSNTINKEKFTFTKFKENANKPIINTKNMWNPYLGNNSVKNNLKLKGKNLIITGPNAAGKSTFIKTVALNIILSQTVGLCAAKKLTLTPFKNISSYLHIPDCKGVDSLFQAEMRRSKEYIDSLSNMPENEFSFVIMDEIFSSTNFVEGFSAAYAIVKKLVSFKNSISIITTHYTNLTKVSDVTDSVKNYKFTIKRDANNEIIYPYKIKKGVSYDYIALELIKKNNFDQDIIDDAINIKNELLEGKFKMETFFVKN
jgi:DNA mismatch repair protein MutS